MGPGVEYSSLLTFSAGHGSGVKWWGLVSGTMLGYAVESHMECEGPPDLGGMFRGILGSGVEFPGVA